MTGHQLKRCPYLALYLRAAPTVIVCLLFLNSAPASESSLFEGDSPPVRTLFQKPASRLSRNVEAGTRLDDATRLVSDGERLAREETADALDQAQRKYLAAIVILRRNSGNDARKQDLLVEALIAQGRTLNDLNRASRAATSLQAAVSASSTAQQRALALAELARSQLALGDTARATTTLQLASEAAMSAGDSVSKLAVIKSRVDLTYELNEVEDALKLALEQSTLAKAMDDRRGYVDSLIVSGLAQSDLNNFEEAMRSYTQAFEVSKEINYRTGLIHALTFIGHLHAKEGRLQQAIENYAKAKPLARTLGDVLKQSWITSGMAYVYEQIGDSKEALSLYQQTLKLRLSIENLPAEASIYRRLASQYFDLREYQQARFFFEKAAALYQRLDQPRYLAVTYRDLGRLNEAIGDWREARQRYSVAKKLMERAKDARSLAYLHAAIGRLCVKEKRFDEASREYRDALVLHRAVRDPRGESEVLFQLGLLAGTGQDAVEARTYLERSLAIDERLRTEIQGPQLRAAHLADVRRHYEGYVDLLMQFGKTKSEDAIRSAFDASEKSRARSLLEELAESRIDIRAGVDPALLDREQAIIAALNEKTRTIIAASGRPRADLNKLNQEIDELTSAYEEVQGRIRANSPQYAASAKPLPLSASEIQQLLEPDTLLLEYMICDQRSYVWAVTSRSIQSFELPGRTKIETAARAVYDALTARNREAPHETESQWKVRVTRAEHELAIASRQLSLMLLGPVAPLLGDKRLLIVADGGLQYVPFAALPLAADASTKTATGPALANEIVSIPSASVVAMQRRQIVVRTQTAMGVAVFADPVFDRLDSRIVGRATKSVEQSTRNRSAAAPLSTPLSPLLRKALRRNGFQRLPFSRQEAEAVLAAAPGGHNLRAMDFMASRTTALSGSLSQFRIIHFATHSYLDDGHPELSGILFSLFDEQGRPQNGFLELREIYKLKLPADLIVLSACETALGKDIRGEGLMSLTRGFMYAGAARVVASLWKVDDAATAELMAQFYQEMLVNGRRPAAALRAAQIHVSRQPRWQSPYYWAGFVLQGEWQ